MLSRDKPVIYCDHYLQWVLLQEKLWNLMGKKSNISSRLKALKCDHDNFEDFYNQLYSLGEALATVDSKIHDTKIRLNKSCKCCCNVSDDKCMCQLMQKINIK